MKLNCEVAIHIQRIVFQSKRANLLNLLSKAKYLHNRYTEVNL